MVKGETVTNPTRNRTVISRFRSKGLARLITQVGVSVTQPANYMGPVQIKDYNPNMTHKCVFIIGNLISKSFFCIGALNHVPRMPPIYLY